MSTELNLLTVMGKQHFVTTLTWKLEQLIWVSTNTSDCCVSYFLLTDQMKVFVKQKHFCISAKDHINVTNGQPGSVCYRSHWDISSSLSKPNNVPDVQFDKGTICFKLTDENFCSDFTVNFTPENCVKSSFKITEYIPVGTYKEMKLYFHVN